jgi:hypothetical protein
VRGVGRGGGGVERGMILIPTYLIGNLSHHPSHTHTDLGGGGFTTVYPCHTTAPMPAPAQVSTRTGTRMDSSSS